MIKDPKIKFQAEKTLQDLCLVLEQHLSPEYDVDYENQSLVIDLNDGRQYLLSFHGVTQQIWLSSPLSGAHHYVWGPQGWSSTRDEITLFQLLEQELTLLCGRSLSL